MGKQKSYVKIPDPEDEEYFIIRKYEFEDLFEIVDQLKPNDNFWEGFQWSILGSGFSVLIATSSYHLFETSPDKKGLLIGYIVGALFIVWAISTFFQGKDRGNDIYISKENLLKILSRAREQNHKLLVKLEEEVLETNLQANNSSLEEDLSKSLSNFKPFPTVFKEKK